MFRAYELACEKDVLAVTASSEGRACFDVGNTMPRLDDNGEYCKLVSPTLQLAQNYGSARSTYIRMK
jgi:hypothetical protein